MSLLIQIFSQICKLEITELISSDTHKHGTRNFAKWRLRRGWKRLIIFKVLAGLLNGLGWGNVLSTEAKGQDNSTGPKWWYLLSQVFVASFCSFKTAVADFSCIMLASLWLITLSNCNVLLWKKMYCRFFKSWFFFLYYTCLFIQSLRKQQNTAQIHWKYHSQTELLSICLFMDFI